jgi:hypothetical protein
MLNVLGQINLQYNTIQDDFIPKNLLKCYLHDLERKTEKRQMMMKAS